jgi:hypothetical protein
MPSRIPPGRPSRARHPIGAVGWPTCRCSGFDRRRRLACPPALGLRSAPRSGRPDGAPDPIGGPGWHANGGAEVDRCPGLACQRWYRSRLVPRTGRPDGPRGRLGGPAWPTSRVSGSARRPGLVDQPAGVGDRGRAVAYHLPDPSRSGPDRGCATGEGHSLLRDRGLRNRRPDALGPPAGTVLGGRCGISPGKRSFQRQRNGRGRCLRPPAGTTVTLSGPSWSPARPMRRRARPRRTPAAPRLVTSVRRLVAPRVARRARPTCMGGSWRMMAGFCRELPV